MTNLQRIIFPRGTTIDAAFRHTTPPMEATVYCPSQVLEHILHTSLSSCAKPRNQTFIHSNPLPFPTPVLPSHDGRFVHHPNSSLALPVQLDVLPTQQYAASNDTLEMPPPPVIDTMSHNPLSTCPQQLVTSEPDMPLLHATSGSVASGPTFQVCSSSTIESQSLIYSFEPNPMKYKAAAQNFNVEETSERFFRSPNLSSSRTLKHIHEKTSSEDESSIQYTTDTPLDLSKRRAQTLDRTSCVTNETPSALNVSSLRSTSHADRSSVANYKYCTPQNIRTIAKYVSKVVATTRMAKSKDKMVDSFSKVHERGNGIATNRTFTPQDKTCSIRESVKRPPRETEMHGQLVAGEDDRMDLKETGSSTKSGIQTAQVSRHGRIKRNEKSLVCGGKKDELRSFHKSSRKLPIERNECDLIKLDDNSSDTDKWLQEFEKMLNRDNIDYQAEQSVDGSKPQVTFDLEQEEEVKKVGFPDGKNLQRKESGKSVNTYLLSYRESLEEDEGKDKRQKVESANIGTKMIERRSSYNYTTPRNFNRKRKVRKSVKRLQKTQTEEKAMKTHRCNTSVRNIFIPMRDVSKLFSGAGGGSQDEMTRSDPVATFEEATCYANDLNDNIKPFCQRVVLKKDDKNMWTVIRSVSRKRNATAMVGPPSNGKFNGLTANFKDNEGSNALRDNRSSFEKGDNEGVKQVGIISMTSSVAKEEGPSNSSASETEIHVNVDGHSSQPSVMEEKLERYRHKDTSSTCVKGVQKPTNYSHLSAKEKVRFLRARMRTSEKEVATFLKKKRIH